MIHKCLYSASEYFPPVGTVSPTYYYMSDCPSEYFLMFVCLFTNTISNGFCNGDFYVDIGFKNNPADSPPFWKVENELYRKLGLRMSDRLTKFRYLGERKNFEIKFLFISSSLPKKHTILNRNSVFGLFKTFH